MTCCGRILSGRYTGVKGKTEWVGVDPHDRLIALRVFLTGEGHSNRGVKFERRFRLGGPYEFRDVPPGQYRLTVTVETSKMRLWEQTITVEAGKEAVLDLTNANSLIPSDQLPASQDEE